MPSAVLLGASAVQMVAGGTLGPITVAYETWGRLSPTADNAVLVCHALTGDSHAAGPAGHGHPQLGWWNPIIGPGRAIDTVRYFVVCPNVLGGCQGTTGPASIDPATGRPYGASFPVTTILDQVAVEAALADRLGIERWAAVVGGSMGGMQALSLAANWPHIAARVLPISATAWRAGDIGVRLSGARAAVDTE